MSYITTICLFHLDPTGIVYWSIQAMEQDNGPEAIQYDESRDHLNNIFPNEILGMEKIKETQPKYEHLLHLGKQNHAVGLAPGVASTTLEPFLPLQHSSEAVQHQRQTNRDSPRLGRRVSRTTLRGIHSKSEESIVSAAHMIPYETPGYRVSTTS
jgi:hypothetical protein